MDDGPWGMRTPSAVTGGVPPLPARLVELVDLDTSGEPRILEPCEWWVFSSAEELPEVQVLAVDGWKPLGEYPMTVLLQAVRAPLPRAARVAAVVLALGCLGLLGGCSTRHPSIEELRKVPGATAIYPRTTTYRAYEQPGQNGVDGGSPSTRATMGCAAGASNRGPVLDWFIGQLEPVGWMRQAPFPSTGTDVTYDVTYTWTRGERQFQLSFVKAAEANSVAAAAGLPTGCPVVYDAVVQ